MKQPSQRLRHFLLVFDHKQAELIRQDEFEDVDEAVEAYEACEAEYEQQDKIEVVLIGADSLETVRQTHANYFDGTAALARALAIIMKEAWGDRNQGGVPA